MAGRRKALIVAVDDYQNPGLRDLSSPAADAEALGAVLGDPRIGDFEVDVVRNQSAHEIQSHIEDLFSDARSDDVLLLHFSGHGLKGEGGDLFFAAANTRPNRLASTAVSADFVRWCMRTSPSRSIVLMLDCCYGGAYSQGVTVRAAGDVNVLDSFPSGGIGGGRGRAVITASNATQYAFEGERLSDDSEPVPSLFTAALVQGLSTGEADRDEDGFVSLDEVYDYVFDRVREQNPNQTPSRDIQMQGELYLAKSVRRPLRPQPLPQDLRIAAEDANPYTRLGAVSELRFRLLNESPPVAAGARDVLLTMASSDTQLVSGAAKKALAELTLRVTPTSLDFGPVPIKTPSTAQRVELSGPPLARHVTIRTEPWIRVRGADDVYEISVSPPEPGATSGTVTLSGAAGDVVVVITAQGQTAAERERPERGWSEQAKRAERERANRERAERRAERELAAQAERELAEQAERDAANQGAGPAQQSPGPPPPSYLGSFTEGTRPSAPDDPLVPGSFSGWLQRVVGVAKRSFIRLATLQVLTGAGALLGFTLGASLDSFLETSLLALTTTVVAAYALVASLFIAVRDAAGQPTAIADGLRFAFGRVLPMTGWLLLAWLLIAGGLLALIIPGFYLAIVLGGSLAGVVVVERAGIERCVRLIKGRFWPTAARLIGAGVVGVIYVVVVRGFAEGVGEGSPVAGPILQAILLIPVGVAATAVAVVTYAELRFHERPDTTTSALNAQLPTPARPASSGLVVAIVAAAGVAIVVAALLVLPPGTLAPSPTVLATVKLDVSPATIAVAPDGHRAYAPSYNSADSAGAISVIDTNQRAVVGSITAAVQSTSSAISPDGRWLYATNYGDSSVMVIDTASNSVHTRIAVKPHPEKIALSPDGRQLYVPQSDSNEVAVIDTTTNTVTGSISAGEKPRGVALSPDGRTAYVVAAAEIAVVDTAGNTVVNQLYARAGDFPINVALSRDGSRAYVINRVAGDGPGSLAVIDTASKTFLPPIEVGQNPDDVVVSRDGRRAYVTNGGSNAAPGGTVSVIDTDRYTVIETLTVGAAPSGLAVSPDGRRLYVANLESGSVSVIDTGVS